MDGGDESCRAGPVPEKAAAATIISSTRANVTGEASTTSPTQGLQQQEPSPWQTSEEVLRLVLEWVGTRQHLFVSLVCRNWRQLYTSLSPTGTSFFAPFCSTSRLEFAAEHCGLFGVFWGDEEERQQHLQQLWDASWWGWRLQSIGAIAPVDVLIFASRQFGLPLGRDVQSGVACAGRWDLLRQLHDNYGVAGDVTMMAEVAALRGDAHILAQLRAMPDREGGGGALDYRTLAQLAAGSGAVATLRWLHSCGLLRESNSPREDDGHWWCWRQEELLSTRAVRWRQRAALEYLTGEARCRKNLSTTKAAAANDDLPLLQHLIASGCAWDGQSLHARAPQGGEVRAWLRQCGYVGGEVPEVDRCRLPCGNGLRVVLNDQINTFLGKRRFVARGNLLDRL